MGGRGRGECQDHYQQATNEEQKGGVGKNMGRGRSFVVETGL